MNPEIYVKRTLAEMKVNVIDLILRSAGGDIVCDEDSNEKLSTILERIEDLESQYHTA